MIRRAQGTDRPSWTHWYQVDDQLVDFSSGFTFTVTCKTVDLLTTLFTLTSGITGAAGSGNGPPTDANPNNTPNITVAWTTATLGALEVGFYKLTLIPRATSGTLDYEPITEDLEIYAI